MNEYTIPISALNHYAFCPRRCALIHVEGIFIHNEHTVKGSLLHDRADRPGHEIDCDVQSIRALLLFSKQYGLSGKADVIERHEKSYVPVEYKKGQKRSWENDNIQLCAQVLCLEEMFGISVPRGFIYHVGSKRRREVVIDQDLRRKTIETIQSVRNLLNSHQVPPAVLEPKCKECSLHEVCLPELWDGRREDVFAP